MAAPLVTFDAASKLFSVDSTAVRALRALSGPIAVIAVCGRARQGKSFLLNQLLQKLHGAAPGAASGSAGFAVGSTVKPCTKGLWLWSKPIQRKLPNGQPYHIVLIDAEGIDSFDQTADYSNHIFSLAVLLSSLLVYNQMGSIDESSVDKLAAVCEFARLIRGRAGGADADLGRDLTPSFVWLLRDFQFQLTEDGRQLTVADYMEEVLREVPGGGEAMRAKNQLRTSIKTLFPDRDCHALVRPMLDEARLAKMDALPASELRPEFRKGLDSLVELLLLRARPKALRGAPLTGPALAALAEAYVRVINEGGVPAIASTWQSVVQSECRRALDAAQELYRGRMEPAREPEVGLEALEAAHSSALEAAVELLSKQALGEPGEREPFLRRLRESAAAAVAPLRQAKVAHAEARCTERLGEAARAFSAAVHSRDPAALEPAEAALHAFLRSLGAATELGPNRYIKAAEFLAGTALPELRRAAQAWAAQAAAAEARAAAAEGKVTELTASAAALRASLDLATAAEAGLRRELAAAQAAAAEAGASLAAARAAAESSGGEAATLRGQLAAARVDAAGQAERAEAEATRLRSELAVATSQRTAAEAAAAQAAEARKAAEAARAARDAEAAAKGAEAVEARRAAEAARSAEAELRSQLAAATASLGERDTTLRHLRAEREHLQAALEAASRKAADAEAAAEAARAAAAGAAAEADAVRQAAASASAAAAAEAAAVRQQAAAATAAAVAEVEAAKSQAAAATAAAAAATAAAAAAAAAASAAPRSAAAARKRGRTESSAEDGDAEMEDAPAAARDGPGGAAAPAAAEEDLVVVVDDMGAAEADEDAGAAEAPTPSGKAPRRQRAAPTPAPRSEKPPPEKRRRVTAARGGADATPAAAAAEGAGGSGAAAATPAAAAPAAASPAPAAGGGGGARTPFSTEREVVLRSPAGRTPPRGAEGGAGAGAGGASTPLPPNLESMTVNALKDWLTSRGHEAAVFELGKSRPTKKEWVALVREKCGGGGGAGA
ncbi:hypothetical protein HYH03_012367 [Edaphochlamys debaryana]|uniref:GB1/RHD3-type G domain-containing protein n=1 Tax=Edaphochlamys debaryana TaxID=47281 RepID=A0A835XVK0_9CHLO|nr:hypothetical protein HYH03_012367 [Edaphochlamys debaryana]|eukprot:KAG2489141.1 hypothetical protein HYH03_012367 [Edaphochlamys debaryana]